GFLLFAETPADVLLLEVGLGGRADATNVVPTPLAAVITPVSLDQEAYLGAEIEAIAREKAGIMKPGRPMVLSPQSEPVLAVMEREAARIGAGLVVGGQDWHVHEERGRLVYEDGAGLLDLPPPRLLGRHQLVNAGTAIAALRATGLVLRQVDFERGLTEVDWPGRLQRLASGTLVAMARGAELWLDGGHNPGAGEVLAAAMADIEERVPRPLVLIAGMLTTKDPVGFFRPFQ